MSVINAAQLVDNVSTKHAQAVELASVVAFSPRVDLPLLRAARTRLLPRYTAEVEGDLWTSDLVMTRSHQGFTMHPQVLALLRSRLASRNGDLYQRAWALTKSMHRWLPSALQLEEELNYLSHADPAERSQRLSGLWQLAVNYVFRPEHSGIATWGAGAAERLAIDHNVEERRMMSAIATLQLRPNASLMAKEDDQWISWVASTTLGSDSVRVEMFAGYLQLTLDPTGQVEESAQSFSQLIKVPQTNPVIVHVAEETEMALVVWFSSRDEEGRKLAAAILDIMSALNLPAGSIDLDALESPEATTISSQIGSRTCGIFLSPPAVEASAAPSKSQSQSQASIAKESSESTAGSRLTIPRLALLIEAVRFDPWAGSDLKRSTKRYVRRLLQRSELANLPEVILGSLLAECADSPVSKATGIGKWLSEASATLDANSSASPGPKLKSKGGPATDAVLQATLANPSLVRSKRSEAVAVTLRKGRPVRIPISGTTARIRTLRGDENTVTLAESGRWSIPNSVESLIGFEDHLERAMSWVREGKSIAITGLAGAGKTQFVRHLAGKLRDGGNVEEGMLASWRGENSLERLTHRIERTLPRLEQRRPAPRSRSKAARAVPTLVVVIESVPTLDLLSPIERRENLILLATIRSTTPVEELKGWSNIHLGGIPVEAATMLLAREFPSLPSWMHREIASATYGLVGPLFEVAKHVVKLNSAQQETFIDGLRAAIQLGVIKSGFDRAAAEAVLGRENPPADEGALA